ncbi:MAG: hypothetical protein GC203_01715 [Phenylobacterium sp.]|uniref:toll/interleukin-1 receptor domain-containing protein n=1 Tax=Phenylobacterium sp. TaxID=1871053 RepID=UPI0025E251C2|nr:toll/interleukin-1 receptor domain-containing protein [Phenylobacterium sp.]MBI1196562.1 hypothetical protein [Phenylobacterium sp.]
MSYSDDYDYELFVSYAQRDNGREIGRPVTQIVERVEGHLRARLGWQNPPRIFFDQFDGEITAPRLEDILKAVGRSAVFLAIGSPNYIVRQWPLAELKLFAELPDASKRLVCAEVLPLDPDAGGYPSPLNELRQVWFWRPDQKTRFPIELHRSSSDYKRAVVTVGERIRTTLQRMAPEANRPPRGVASLNPMSLTKPDSVPQPEAPKPGRAGGTAARPKSGPEPCVVVGVVGRDMEPRVDELAASLAMGANPITVLPARPCLPDRSATMKAFEADLRRASVFVQLLGVEAPLETGGFPDGRAQYELETAHALEKPVRQWRLPDLRLDEIDDDNHRQLVAESSCPIRGFEEFKAEIRQIALAAAAPRSPPANVFIYAPRTRIGHAEELRRIFEAAEFSVALPMGATAGEIRRHRDQMFSEAEILMFVPDTDPDTLWIDDNLDRFDISRAQRPDPKALGICSIGDDATPLSDATVTTVRPRRNGAGPRTTRLKAFIEELHT